MKKKKIKSSMLKTVCKIKIWKSLPLERTFHIRLILQTYVTLGGCKSTIDHLYQTK